MRWHWARWRAFVHATEDEARVRDAVLWLMAQEGDVKGADRIERKRAKGHWGNDIVVLEGALTKSPAIGAALERVLGDNALRSDVRAKLDRALDEDGVLHIRLDKQGAVLGQVRSTRGGDAIVVTIKAERMPGDDVKADWAQWLDASAQASGPAA